MLLKTWNIVHYVNNDALLNNYSPQYWFDKCYDVSVSLFGVFTDCPHESLSLSLPETIL